MKVAELFESASMIPKRVPDGYREGKWTWAVVVNDAYGDEVVESGFDTKKDALAWIAKQQ